MRALLGRGRWALLGLALLVAAGLPADSRSGYRAVFGQRADGTLALRAWTDDQGRGWLLTVDPATLLTAVRPGSADDLAPRVPASTPWDRLRAAAAARRLGLQNAGLRRGLAPRPGAWLSFDLCPSSRPLERGALSSLELPSGPLPVFLEVSGRWLDRHAADWDWLDQEQAQGRLTIVWVNHTEHHEVLPGVAWDKNFLLTGHYRLDDEIFRVEERLLDHGDLPSVFFRFPGLISSPALVDRVLALGLIPLGSSAWLAKQQALRSGAVVLTHANGNEPEGLALLLAWARDHRSEVAAGSWSWLGLEDWVKAAGFSLK